MSLGSIEYVQVAWKDSACGLSARSWSAYDLNEAPGFQGIRIDDLWRSEGLLPMIIGQQVALRMEQSHALDSAVVAK